MKYLLIIFVTILVSNSYANDFSISSNLGISFPLGNFKDNRNIYSNCNKDSYSKNPKVKIENSSLNSSFYYDFSLSYYFSKSLKINAILKILSNKFSGITISSSKEDVNTHQLITNLTNPEFNSTNLCIGIDYSITKLDNLMFFAGLEPNFVFNKYNTYSFFPAVPSSYIKSNEVSKTSFGICGKIGIEYSINQDLSIILACNYLIIFTDYNHEALSIEYTCFPINNYYSNPKYLIPNIGIGYKIF